MKITLINLLNKLVCKCKGHNFETYAFSTGFWSDDIEQAGVCTRCGFDTHLKSFVEWCFSSDKEIE